MKNRNYVKLLNYAYNNEITKIQNMIPKTIDNYTSYKLTSLIIEMGSWENHRTIKIDPKTKIQYDTFEKNFTRNYVKSFGKVQD